MAVIIATTWNRNCSNVLITTPGDKYLRNNLAFHSIYRLFIEVRNAWVAEET